jgi:hypothetical protein
VSYPHGAFVTERIEQRNEIADVFFHRVIFVAPVYGGSAVTAKIRRDGAEAESAKHRQLVPPAVSEFRPAMREYDGRAGFRPGGEVGHVVAVEAAGQCFNFGVLARHRILLVLTPILTPTLRGVTTAQELSTNGA